MLAKTFCILAAIAFLTAACAAKSDSYAPSLAPGTPVTDGQVEIIVKALDSICLTSEGGQSAELVTALAVGAGFLRQAGGDFRLGEVVAAPGGPNMIFCDIKVFGDFVDVDLLIKKLGAWAVSAAALEVIDAPAAFESGEDHGTRVVWGRGDIRLAAYIYDNMRADGRRVRIMYDAI